MIIGSIGILIGSVGILKWWIWRLVLWTFSVGILKRRYWYFDSACWYFDRVRWYFDRVCWYFDRVCWYFDSLVFWTLVFWTLVFWTPPDCPWWRSPPTGWASFNKAEQSRQCTCLHLHLPPETWKIFMMSSSHHSEQPLLPNSCHSCWPCQNLIRTEFWDIS